MDLAIKLIVLLPMLAAAIAGLFCRVIGDRPAQIVTCAALLAAAALSVFVFVRIGFGPESGKLVVVQIFSWIDSGTLDINWSLRVDTLTAVMLIVVTGVSSMVHVYSVGYMVEDPSIPRFMAYLSLFTFGILGIFLNRKNVIVILMCVELMLLAVNINLVAFSVFQGNIVGQVFAMLVLTVAAAEAAIGLAILVVFFRNRGSIEVEDISAMKG